MLSLRIQKLGDAIIVHCTGRIALRSADVLRAAVLRQSRVRTLVLDMADVIAVDAAGLGILVSLRDWAKETRTDLKLMNLPPRVEQLLELTNLLSAFEVCSAREMLDLLCRALDEAESARFSPAMQAHDIDPTSCDGSLASV
jgi:anti-sigma B factor antagonist